MQTNMQDFRETEKIVIRRFSDFVWLYERLMECYKGVILPSLPGKNAVGKILGDRTNSILAFLDLRHCQPSSLKGNMFRNWNLFFLSFTCNAEKFRFTAEFIEVRRKALDVFLKRVTAHPELRKSEDLKNFLQADEEIWVGVTKILIVG